MSGFKLFLRDISVVVVALPILAFRTASAHAEVSAPPDSRPSEVVLHEMESTAEPAVETEPAVRSPPLGDRSLFGVPMDVSPVEADRLIKEYQRQAGAVGPNRFFSQSKITPHVSVAAAYDDNILASTDARKKGDGVFSPSAGITISLGDFIARAGGYLVFDYTGIGEIYARNSDLDAYNQTVQLDAQYRWNQLVARLSSGFRAVSDTTVDLGERVKRKIYDESLLVRYDRSEKISFQSELSYSYTDYSTPIDISEISLANSFDYQLFKKVKAGTAFVLGRLDASGSVGEDYQQLLARVSYEVSGKILIGGQFGVEYRERGSNAGDEATPVFVLAGRWTPYEGTIIDLNAYRRIDASAAREGADFVDTGFRLSLRQRLVKRFYAQAEVGYDNADYGNVTGDSLLSRNDNYYLVRGEVGYDFVDWFKTQLFYQHRQNESTNDSFSFASNRVGVEMDLLY